MRAMRVWVSVVIATLLAGAAASAALGAGATRAPKAATTAKPAAAKPKPKSTTRAPASKTPTAASATVKPKATAADSTGPRTLDEITIEGEIPVPQVLFITARDQRRFLDLRHHRYLKNSQRVGETTVYPSWISVAHGVTPEEPKP